DHVQCRNRQAVQVENIVDLPIEILSNIHAGQTQRAADQIEILNYRARLQQRKTVTTVSIPEDRTLRHRGDEDNHRRCLSHTSVQKSGRELLRLVATTQETQAVSGWIVV